MTDEETPDVTTVGSFVWAKVSGHPFWPGQVVETGPGIKARAGYVVVRFFGSNDFASLKPAPEQIKSYKAGTTTTPGKKNRKVRA
jgi:hypothetical protein